MKFKEFVKWCNERAADGCWSMNTAMFCGMIIRTVNNYPFWARNKVWQQFNNDYSIEKDVVVPINQKIEIIRR